MATVTAPRELLATARAALVLEDRSAALGALLAAWRLVRSARIAAVIELVRDDLAVARPPIEGKTVQERTRAWLEIAARRDPVDLPRLLTTPRTGGRGPRDRAFRSWPDDPLLVPPDEGAPLPATLDAEVDALEAMFASSFARADAGTRQRAELVAAIHADPDNRDLKSVFADVLVQHGDPRGELAALQIAGTQASAPRERTLIEKHGERWAGAIGVLFLRDSLVFVDGWFAGGIVHASRAQVVASLGDPAWRLVRVLAAAWDRDDDVLALLARPELAGVRTVYLNDEASGARLAGGPADPRLADLRVGLAVDAVVAGDGSLARCEALPALRTLGLRQWNCAVLVDFARRAPVLERVERWVVATSGLARELVEVLAAREGALRELVVLSSRTTLFEDREGWTLSLRREVAPGPFRFATLRFRARGSVTQWHWTSTLLALLVGCPDGLAELRVEAPRQVLAAADRHRLAAAIARLAPARAIVPWEAPPAIVAGGVALRIRFVGDGLLDRARLAEVWQRVAVELGQHYDVFSLGANPTLRAIGKAPVAKLATWAANPRTRSIQLRHDGTRRRLVLEKPTESMSSSVIGELECGARSIPEIVEALLGILELGAFETGEVMPLDDAGAGEPFPFAGYGRAPSHGWLLVFGNALVARLPLHEVETLAGRPELEGMFAFVRGRYLVIGVSATPAGATTERVAAVMAGLREILYRQVPFDLHARAIALLGNVARELGLPPGERDATTLRVRFGDRLVVSLADPFEHPRLRVELANRDLTGGWIEVPTHARLDAVLLAAATAAREVLDRGAGG